jgi:hypothetical protein
MKKRDTDGAWLARSHSTLFPVKSVFKQASSLVFIYQKIETKTIWSRTDPNLIPSFFQWDCGSNMNMKLHIARRIRARRALQLLYGSCLQVVRHHVPGACATVRFYTAWNPR